MVKKDNDNRRKAVKIYNNAVGIYNEGSGIRDYQKAASYFLSSCKVYLLRVGSEDKGTVTINGNEIDRLFVLPDSQHNGYGKILIDFAENAIKQTYGSIMLAASLPAKKIYKRYGYVETQYCVNKREI